jgi:hypothetical protein
MIAACLAAHPLSRADAGVQRIPTVTDKMMIIY